MDLIIFIGVAISISCVTGEQKYSRLMVDQLFGAPYYKRNVKSLLECAVICEKDNCVVYSFHHQTLECFIYDKDQVATPTSPTLPGLITFARKRICVDGRYTLFNELMFCLKVYTYLLAEDWLSAKDVCEDDGGRLLVIKQFAETKAALVTFIEADLKYWLGGMPVNGTWKWLDGTLIDMSTDWATGEPQSSNGDSCLYYFTSSNLLSDAFCTYVRGFICEMQAIEV